MSDTQAPPLPRELILASAGTGKTFQISTRIIGLLAAGAPPDSIFASTFTRKAAGEILDKVLEKLSEASLDAGAAARLVQHTTIPGLAPPLPTPEGWLGILERVVRDLHRVNIGTLDSFFVRSATTFSDELGLPPGWTIADPPVMDRVRSEALQEVLSSADSGVIIELVRAESGAGAGRSVHAGLLSRARDLLEIHHALDPDAVDPWSGLEPFLGAPPIDPGGTAARLASSFEAVEVPLTRTGEPNKSWQSALLTAADMIRAGDWDAFTGSTLCVNSRVDGGAFSRVPIPPEVQALLDEACALARWMVGRRLVAQGQAKGRLAALLAAAVEARQRETGSFEFADLTRLIGGPDPIGERPDLYYRLDARAQHILLDEFQDTSFSQWEALEPLLDELLSGHAEDRAALVVADPKQSIYAWRGGEPRLVEHVRDRYHLHQTGMHRSWRSSQVVLDAVNEIFRGLESNGVFGADEGARRIAAEWKSAFAGHVEAIPRPGHVRVLVGPPDEGSGSDRPMLCRRAAELVQGLRTGAPGRTIGVLTRRNQTVARMMLELGRLGVPSSEEGGNPVTDSKAVSSVLAVFRLTDHPGDTVSRYHVARTPIGAVLGFTDHRDDGAANRLAHDLRRRLVLGGYGQTIEQLAAGVRDVCSARERRRLDQLVELAFRYDDRSTLRVSEFLRLVDAERVEDPTAADVRVMTVHQAKGLEFDVVVLPELDFPLERERPIPLAYRPARAARVTRAFPYVPGPARALFADVQELTSALADARAGRLRDGLSALYVALTRARHALHVVVKPDGENGMGAACTAAALVRHAIGATGPAAEGDILYEMGDPRWHLSDGVGPGQHPSSGDDGSALPQAAPDAAPQVRLRAGASRTRGFARRTPSELAAGSKVDLRAMLNLESLAAVEGTIAHAWFERIGWIEEGTPPEDELRQVAKTIDPGIPADRLEALLAAWNGWMADPVIRAAVSRSSFAPGAVCERELRFIHRDGDAVLEGAIDRLVLLRSSGQVTGAVILDYKTDGIERGDEAGLKAKADLYRPQLDAYRRAVARWYALPPDAVSCRLVVLRAGAVVEV